MSEETQSVVQTDAHLEEAKKLATLFAIHVKHHGSYRTVIDTGVGKVRVKIAWVNDRDRFYVRWKRRLFG